jgi:hypothetical protein
MENMCPSRPWKALCTTATILLLTSPPAAPASLACNGGVVAQSDFGRTWDEKISLDVLANDEGPAGVALAVEVVSESCPGSVTIDFDALLYTPSQPLTTDCTITYRAGYPTSGSPVWSNNTTVTIVALPEPPDETLIFADDFESGGLTSWSSCEGCS